MLDLALTRGPDGARNSAVPEAVPTPSQVAFRLFEGANRIWSEVAGEEQDLRRQKHPHAERLGLAQAALGRTVTASLKRLESGNVLAHVEPGTWQFEDPAFARWVRELDGAEPPAPQPAP